MECTHTLTLKLSWKYFRLATCFSCRSFSATERKHTSTMKQTLKAAQACVAHTHKGKHIIKITVPIHAYPQKYIFKNKNHQHRNTIFRNTSANVSLPLLILATRLYEKIRRQCTLCNSLTDSAQLRTPSADHAWLSASLIISQQYCELQSACKCHLSHRWWWKATSHRMLSCAFGNIYLSLETVLQVCNQNTQVMLSVIHKTFFLQMAPWFRRSIWLTASQMPCSLWETLE